jgi:lysophospholipase L1-like esterase
LKLKIIFRFLILAIVIGLLFRGQGRFARLRHQLAKHLEKETPKPTPVVTLEEKKPRHGQYNRRVQELQQLPNLENEIIFLGDSITRGGKWSELFKNDTDQPIYNFGISGDTTEGILQRLDHVISFEPAKLFLLIGINDLWNETKTREEILNNYRLILDQIKQKSPNTKIYLQSILPINREEYQRTILINLDIVFINQEIAKLAQEYNYQYIDLYSQFVNSEDKLNLEYSNDGLHLNQAGYLLWKNIITDYVKN